MAGARPGPARKTKAQREYEGQRPKRAAAGPPAPDLPPPASLAPPADLGPIARAFWDRFAPILARGGVLTEADTAALEVAACAWQRWKRLETAFERGDVAEIVTTAKGGQMVNPLVYVRESAEKAAREWLSHFGMTPAARAKVRPVAPEEKRSSNPIEDGLRIAMGT